jgi:phage shock protein A
MKPEEFTQLMTKIAQNADNQGLVTELSTQAIEAYKNTSQTLETLNTKVGDYETKVSELKEKNMELFLKVAQPIPTEPLQKAEPLSYDSIIESLGGK